MLYDLLLDCEQCERKMVFFLRINFISFMNVLDRYKYTSFNNQPRAFLKKCCFKFQVKCRYSLMKDSNNTEKAKPSSEGLESILYWAWHDEKHTVPHRGSQRRDRCIQDQWHWNRNRLRKKKVSFQQSQSCPSHKYKTKNENKQTVLFPLLQSDKKYRIAHQELRE